MAPAFVLFWLLGAGVQVVAPVEPARLAGRVVDAATSTPLPDVRLVLVPASGRAAGDSAGIDRTTQTNADGAFAFDGLQPGTYTLSVSTVGYIFVRRTVVIGSEEVRDLVVPLSEGTGAYRETVEVGTDPGRPAIEAMTEHVLGSADLQALRGVIADDPLRAVQALPGVATADDFRSEFSVRGSAFRHTGIVIDGTPAPFLLHTVRGESNTGSVAMVNSDVLSRAALLSGPHARKHGDWLGASLELDMREGSRDRTGFRLAVSGTSASAVVEGPVGRTGRGAWIFSARRSYLDWLIRKVEPEFTSTLGFHDGFFKLTYDVAPRHQLQVLAVAGDATYRQRDAGLVNGLARARSRSTLGSVAWRYTGSRAMVTTRLSFTGSDFHNTGVLEQELARGYTQGLAGRIDAVVGLARGWTLEAGAVRERQRMNEIARRFRLASPGQLRVQLQRDISPRTWLASAWMQLARETDRGGVVAGLRLSDRTISNRLAVSPWLLVQRRAGPWTWQAGAGASAQFPDALFVIDPTEPIRPERSAGGDLGLAYQPTPTTEWRVVAFARADSDALRLRAEHRLDPLSGLRRLAGAFPEYQPSLDGQSRGVDIVFSRRGAAGLTGWVAYTWSHTRLTDQITGESFDGDFDQRHTLNAVGTVRLSWRTTAGLKLRIGSNVPIAGYFEGTPEDIRLASVRNGVRLPVYARLDLRGTRTFSFAARRLTLFVEIMNVFGRRNYGQSEGVIRSTLQADGFVERLVPFVPSAGMLLEF
jgi:hypothetical protein